MGELAMGLLSANFLCMHVVNKLNFLRPAKGFIPYSYFTIYLCCIKIYLCSRRGSGEGVGRGRGSCFSPLRSVFESALDIQCVGGLTSLTELGRPMGVFEEADWLLKLIQPH